jgi:simple sugar transport system permease protein
MQTVLRGVYLLKGVWAILAALAVGSVLIWLGDSDPVEAYGALFTGAFFEDHGFATTLVKMSPILLAGLAVAVPLRAGQFNIGAEGQIYLGGLFATWAALYLPEMPGFIHIIVCSLAGMLGGGLWALIPGYLKAYHNVNEVIVTLLMNYIGINLVSYFVSGPMLAEGAPYPYSIEIREELWLPLILPRTDAHLGAVIGVLFAVVLYVVFKRSSVGLSLATVGHNPAAARYAGISVRRHIMLSLAFGGALAGLAGAYEVLGLKYRLFHMFSAGYGFDGIVVALLAEANPLWVTVAALFLSGLRSGANIMQRAVGVPTTVVEAIQGLVIIFVAASMAFRYETSIWARVMRRRREADAALAAERAADGGGAGAERGAAPERDRAG